MCHCRCCHGSFQEWQKFFVGWNVGRRGSKVHQSIHGNGSQLSRRIVGGFNDTSNPHKGHSRPCHPHMLSLQVIGKDLFDFGSHQQGIRFRQGSGQRAKFQGKGFQFHSTRGRDGSDAHQCNGQAPPQLPPPAMYSRGRIHCSSTPTRRFVGLRQYS